MTIENEQTKREKSEDIAGPSHEVSKRDQNVPITGFTMVENEELKWAQRHVPEELVPETGKPVTDKPILQHSQTVFRKTELHGMIAASTPDKMKKLRLRTMQNLKSPGATVSYHPFETAFKDFICSLMERQDMIAEGHLHHIAELQQQINAFEDRLDMIEKTSSSQNTEGKT